MKVIGFQAIDSKTVDFEIIGSKDLGDSQK